MSRIKYKKRVGSMTWEARSCRYPDEGGLIVYAFHLSQTLVAKLQHLPTVCGSGG